VTCIRNKIADYPSFDISRKQACSRPRNGRCSVTQILANCTSFFMPQMSIVVVLMSNLRHCRSTATERNVFEEMPTLQGVSENTKILLHFFRKRYEFFARISHNFHFPTLFFSNSIIVLYIVFEFRQFFSWSA